MPHVRLSRSRVLVSVSIAGCSLARLGEFDAPHCSRDADCAAATTSAGQDPGKCLVYFCNARSGLCEKAGPGEAERCDGSDNNCDGFIDEALPSTRADAAAPTSGLEPFSYVFDDATQTAFVASTSASAVLSVIPVAHPEESTQSELEYDWDGRPGGFQTCPTRNGPASCNFSQIAVAASESQLFFASVNELGCAQGQVRIGVSDASAPAHVRLGKSEASRTEDSSNINYGVDVGDGLCTGMSRTPAAKGASSPAVAAAPGKKSFQALAAWLATAPETDGCVPAAPSALEALGVFIPEGESGWVNGISGGRPTVVGSSSQRAPPAILASQRHPGDYLLAFPATEPMGEGLNLVAARFTASTDATLTHRLVGFVPAATPHHPTLTLHRDAKSGLDRTVLAFRSGCSAKQSIRFVELDWNGTERALVTSAVEIAAGNVVRGPQVLHAGNGFSISEPTGGWFVLWVEARDGAFQLELARVAERTTRLLGIRSFSVGRSELSFPFPLRDSDLGIGTLHETGVASGAEIVEGHCFDRG